MKSRLLQVLAAIVMLTLFSFSGFAEQGTMDLYKSASLEGTTGLFKTWDAEALRQGEFNLSFGYDQLNRDPGQLTIGNFIIGGAIGIFDRLEFFEAVDVQRSVSGDNVEFNRSGMKPLPATVLGGDGSPYFTQAAPFIDTGSGRGFGDVRMGVKVNLLSEGRGNSLGMGIAGFVKIPGQKATEGLNEGLSSGAYQGGFAALLSKTANDFMRLHLNLGLNWTGDPKIGSRTLATLQNEFVYRGGVEFPAHKPYRIIAELSGIKYYGPAQTGLNPSDPIDFIAGMRVYPANWFSLGAGYQASLNHIDDGAVTNALGAGTHGFVVQGAFGLRRNDPPTLSCAVAQPTILQEEKTTVRANAVDPEGKDLDFTWDTSGGKISGSGDTVTFDTMDAAPGEYAVTAIVSDGKRESSCVTEITVLKKNYPPVVAIEPASVNVIQGDSVNLTAKASDPNKDPLTYEWTVDGNRLAATGPQITFGSEGRKPGTYKVTVTVSDGEASASSTAIVTIQEKPNNPPVVNCLTSTLDVTSGESVELRVRATDPDGHALTYSFSSPVGRVNGSGETATFDATGVKAGTYAITATATDSRGGKGSCTISVNVSERLSVTKDKCGQFGYLSVRVDNCAKAILDDLSVRMKNEPQLRANIIGYVDGRYEASNKTLGERRATAVVRYLESKGVESSRLSITNGGANNQIGDLKTSAGRKLNRRVEIELSVR